MFDDVFFLLILAVLGPLGFLATIVFVAFVMKKTFDAYQAQQQAVHRHVSELEQMAWQSGGDAQWREFLQAAHQMQAAVDRRARQRGGAPAGALATQFATGWSKAQLELNHFDRLSRERADLHLADMRSQGAEMGLFL